MGNVASSPVGLSSWPGLGTCSWGEDSNSIFQSMFPSVVSLHPQSSVGSSGCGGPHFASERAERSRAGPGSGSVLSWLAGPWTGALQLPSQWGKLSHRMLSACVMEGSRARPAPVSGTSHCPQSHLPQELGHGLTSPPGLEAPLPLTSSWLGPSLRPWSSVPQGHFSIGGHSLGMP